MINLIGLGKMGKNLMLNLMDNDIKVRAYDKNPLIKKNNPNLNITSTLMELIDNQKPQIYWMMLPAGDTTEAVFKFLCDNVKEDSIIIDGGNANYKDSRRRYEISKKLNINYMDIGVSGGTEGARYGASMMVGGDFRVFQDIEAILSKICVTKGYIYVGESGSGHYLKMIHNGIEYGMMQSIAEGFNILFNNDLYQMNLQEISEFFNHGTVIRSWLMELLSKSLSEDPELENLEGIVGSSGEGLWTVEEALRLGLNAPVLAQSLFVRFASNDENRFGEKVTASLRNQFGGHSVRTVKK